MTNQLHQATAILRDGVLYVEGFPNEEPNIDSYGWIANYSLAHNEWLASKVSYVFADQEDIRQVLGEIIFSTESLLKMTPKQIWDSGGIPLPPELLHRIEIVDGTAVLKEIDPLWKLFVKETYPSMYRDDDYAELDYTDIEEFNFWLTKNYTITPKTK